MPVIFSLSDLQKKKPQELVQITGGRNLEEQLDPIVATQILEGMTQESFKGRKPQKGDEIFSVPFSISAVAPFLRSHQKESSTLPRPLSAELQRTINPIKVFVANTGAEASEDFVTKLADRYPLLAALLAAEDRQYIAPMLICGGLKGPKGKLMEDYKQLITLDHEVKKCFMDKNGETVVKSDIELGPDHFIAKYQAKLGGLEDMYLKLIEDQTKSKEGQHPMIDPKHSEAISLGIDQFRIEKKQREELEKQKQAQANEVAVATPPHVPTLSGAAAKDLQNVAQEVAGLGVVAQEPLQNSAIRRTNALTPAAAAKAKELIRAKALVVADGITSTATTESSPSPATGLKTKPPMTPGHP